MIKRLKKQDINTSKIISGRKAKMLGGARPPSASFIKINNERITFIENQI